MLAEITGKGGAGNLKGRDERYSLVLLNICAELLSIWRHIAALRQAAGEQNGTKEGEGSGSERGKSIVFFDSVKLIQDLIISISIGFLILNQRKEHLRRLLLIYI